MKPKDAVGDPDLIMFSDGSDEAYGTCAYVRWNLANGKFGSVLVAAKSRVNPVRKITSVRAELNGALLSKRPGSFIKKESRLNFLKEYLIVNSEIVRAMIKKESYGFNNLCFRQSGGGPKATAPSDWYWVEGHMNIAGWTTRRKEPQILSENLITILWQQGPKFLQLDESERLIKNTSLTVELAELTKKVF